jgi:selenophosphate synthetase-related protein
MEDWLTCFPAFGFLLCVPRGREAECLAPFHARGLAAAAVGVIDESGLLALRAGGVEVTVLDLASDRITGLAH